MGCLVWFGFRCCCPIQNHSFVWETNLHTITIRWGCSMCVCISIQWNMAYPHGYRSGRRICTIRNMSTKNQKRRAPFQRALVMGYVAKSKTVEITSGTISTVWRWSWWRWQRCCYMYDKWPSISLAECALITLYTNYALTQSTHSISECLAPFFHTLFFYLFLSHRKKNHSDGLDFGLADAFTHLFLCSYTAAILYSVNYAMHFRAFVWENATKKKVNCINFS